MKESLLQNNISAETRELAALLTKNGLYVSTAESLTGGLISAAFVDVPGCTGWFSDGFITYSDASKTKRLGVDAALIAAKTAVSAEVALQMARGARERSGADFAVAVTGLAGPFADDDGNTLPLAPCHEPGLVFIAAAAPFGETVVRRVFSGDRRDIRLHTVLIAVQLLKNTVQSAP